MANETCSVEVWRGSAWHEEKGTCGKPVKRNGLCGVHARSADIRAAQEAQITEQVRRRTLARDTAKRLTDELHVHFYAVGEHVSMDAEVAADVLCLGLLRAGVSR